MPVPTHRPGCLTRLWKANCPDCGERVYFFSCSCGSKVFFQHPGDPWPLHADRCLPHLAVQLKGQGLSSSAILQLVESEARSRKVSVPPTVYQMLKADEYSDTGRITIVQVRPGGTEEKVRGVIVSSNLRVNFLKRLGYPENQLSRGLLGELGRDCYIELQIRGDADPVTGICLELVCFVSRRIWHALSLRIGARIDVMLKAHRLPNNTEIWLADNVQRDA